MKYIKWWLVFGLILATALIYHLLKIPSASDFLGFPNWVWAFGAIHIVFGIAMFFFAKTLDTQKL